MTSRLLKHDVAYCCFLFWASTVLVVQHVMASLTDDDLMQGAGNVMLVFLPFLGASLIAMLVGIALSIRVWKHWPLIVIAVSSVLSVRPAISDMRIDEYSTEFGSIAFQKDVPIIYGAGVAAMSALWFLRLRRRYVQPPLPAVNE